jgi:ribonucleoside-diphosphate reductase beta chain
MALVNHTHEAFTTTTTGLRYDIPPMILFERAKRLGIWNPADIDFTQDAEDWKNLTAEQHSYLKSLCSRFISGEEAVTLDLLPLMKAVSESGHLEEAMFLTTFLWEEAKHIDFFTRALAAFRVDASELEEYHSPYYRQLFYQTLPERMNVLYHDPSPANLVRASATYNLSIEGVLAETGYYIFFSIMDEYNILPGTRQGIRNLQMDESRHIAYGVFLLSRLVAEDDSLFGIVEEVLAESQEYQRLSSEDNVKRFGQIPFKLDYEQIGAFSRSQYERRLARIQKARGKSIEELYRSGKALLEESGS